MTSKPPSGLIAAAAVLATLAGALAWLAIVTRPLALASGLLEARSHLERAERRLASGALKQARYETLAAHASAQRAATGAARPQPLLDVARLLPRARDALDQLDHLIAAATHSAEAASGTFEVAQSALRGPNPIVVDDPANPRASKIRIERVEQIGAVVSAVRADVRSARAELEAVDPAALPRRLRGALERGIRRTEATEVLLADAEAGFAILPGLLGSDEPRNYLLGFQNSAEQRGTGGAMLQFARLRLDRGRPDRFRIGSVYKLDRNRRPIDIPLPDDAWYVANIEDAQRFGNANWSPHWPLSAGITIDYARASSERLPGSERLVRFDGAVAVDPLTMQELMPGVGRYRIGAGNRMTEAKIVHFVLYKAYASYPVAAVRRVVLGDVVNGFYTGLLKPAQPSALAEGMGAALGAKHMQIWLADAGEQRFVERMGWDGAIDRSTRGDYVFVVEQNVGGNKLDYFDEGAIATDVRFAGVDALVRTAVSITNGIFLPQPRWSMGDSGPYHRPMLNLYVPGSAELLGWDAPDACDPVPGPDPCRLDTPAPAAWLEGRPPEHRERGKKVWSATLEVPPQRRGSVAFRYRVPGAVRTRGDRRVYRLVVQHQPKVRPERLRVRVRLPGGATDVSAPGWRRAGRALVWERRLEEDTVLEVSWRS